MTRFIQTIKNYWQPLILAALVMIFWFPILFDHQFFMDDWDFIKVFESGNFSFAYLFAPHNEHLMPIFKLLFWGIYRIFGVNIFPAMVCSILLHIINTLLFFSLCKIIFRNQKKVPFITTLIFSLSVVYYEVLHWFTVINTAFCLCFLMLTLIFLWRFIQSQRRSDYLISLITAFMIPVGFSLGILGLFFIVLFYFCVIKTRPLQSTDFSLTPSPIKKLKDDLLLLSPYLLVWLLFLVIYYFLVFIPRTSAGVANNFSFTFDPQIYLQFITLGWVGIVTKSLAINILSQPQALLIGLILLINLFFLFYLLILYFFLNKKTARVAVLSNRRVAFFAITGALLSFAILPLARGFVSADALLNWGRYQYFPYFFICILIGNSLPGIYKILCQSFGARRLKIFAGIILLLFLLIQLISIRYKASASIQTEGALPPSVSQIIS